MFATNRYVKLNIIMYTIYKETIVWIQIYNLWLYVTKM